MCAAHFKAKSDAGPPKKKKKCKKKSFKEKSTEKKTPQQKPSPSPAAQKGPVKLNGSKTPNVNGSTAQQPKGLREDTHLMYITVSSSSYNECFLLSCYVFFYLQGGNAESKFSTVDILRKRLHEKIEESRGQVCSI